MSAVAAAGQSCADVIAARLDSERVWLQHAQDRYLATHGDGDGDGDDDDYAARKAAYQVAWQRWLVLAELARDCGLVD
jgi:hypothetical protein